MYQHRYSFHVHKKPQSTPGRGMLPKVSNPANNKRFNSLSNLCNNVHKSIITTRTVIGETTSIKINLSAPHIYQRVLQLKSNPTLQPLIMKILRWWLKFRRQTACALPAQRYFQIAGHKTCRQTSEIRTNAISKVLFCIMLYHGSLFEFVDRV